LPRQPSVPNLILKVMFVAPGWKNKEDTDEHGKQGSKIRN